jgi:GcrA cell cycle regulator
MNWTDERVERLKKLWSEGLSASQIAAQLGGVSRNAVIGKVHRLNLPGRAKAGGSTAQSRAVKRPAAPQQRPTTFTARPQQQARPVVRSAGAVALKEDMDLEAVEAMDYRPAGKNVVLPISRRLSLTDLTERTCKWPVGDPLKDDFHFCGCESSDTSPYCKYHAKLAYQPVHDRRKASAARA